MRYELREGGRHKMVVPAEKGGGRYDGDLKPFLYMRRAAAVCSDAERSAAAERRAAAVCSEAKETVEEPPKREVGNFS